MFNQFLQNSFAVLRRPTVKSFQEVNVDNWRWAFVYLAGGAVLNRLIVIVSNFIQGAVREKQWSEISQRWSSSLAISLLRNLQNPLVNLVVGIITFLLGIILWFFLPYWLGQALGGSKSFGKYVYNNSLFLVPVSLLNALLDLALSRFNGGLYILLSLSLEAFCFYLVYVNLQATMGLSKKSSLFVVAVPIVLEFIVFCGVVSFFIITSFSQ